MLKKVAIAALAVSLLSLFPTISSYAIPPCYSVNGSGVLTSGSDCTGSITIDSPVTSIGNAAFYENTSLTSVTIGNAVSSIGDNAFAGNTSLTSVTIGNAVSSIGDGAFLGTRSLTSVIIPNSVTNVGYVAFADSALTSVTIGNSVTTIGTDAFYRTSLTSVTIPNSVTSIGESAFYLTPLTSVTIGNSVTTIGSSAFAENGDLVSVTFLGNAPSVGSDAFFNLSVGATAYVTEGATGFNLAGDPPRWNGLIVERTACTGGGRFTVVSDIVTSNSSCAGIANFPVGVTSIGNGAFYGNTSLTSVTIPNSVTSIADDAFYGNTSLTSVTIPNSVTSIGGYAFYNNTSLTSVTIGNSVEEIGDGAFQFAPLTSITIPNSVTTIGFDAFRNTSLTSVTFLGNAPSVGSDAFENLPTGATAYVSPSATGFEDSADPDPDEKWFKLIVTVVVPTATYSQSTLTESGANDGSITATITITLSAGSIFTYYEATDLASGRVFNVPAGLTAVLRSGSDRTFATLSFTGAASAHANANDISNLTVTFFSGDFTPNGVPSGANRNNLVIDFAAPADTIAPTLSSSSPSDDATGVAINSNIVFTFSETVTAGPGNIKLRKLSDGSNVEIFDVATSTRVTGWGTTTITINPTADLLNSTGYYLLITTDAIKDASDNFYAGLSGASTLNFTSAVTGGGGAPIPAPVIPTYRITYSANAADVITTPYDFNAYMTGQKITVTSQLPTRLGYSFVEWNTTNVGDGTSYKASANITVGSSDVILYAIWKINKYTISFNSNDGPTLNLNQITQDFNATITVPALPQDGLRIGYTFLGWNTSTDGSGSPFSPSDKLRIGAANLTLFAQWKINQYTLAYDANGHDIGRVPVAVTQDFNSKVTVSAPSMVFTRKGYTFNGWNLTMDGSGTSLKVGDTFILGASNQTLYALWTPKEYQVTFLNSLKNPLPKGQFVSGGVIASAPTPSSRMGFLFKGWSSKADKSKIITFPYEPGVFRNVTLYAVWVKTK